MKNIRFFLCAFMIFICVPFPCFSAYLDLAWNPNGESDLAGYRVYYGTASGNYGSPLDVGNVITYRLTGLNDGVTYYVALTAYDTSNNESAKSIEVNGIPPDTQGPTVTITVPTSSPTFVTSIGTIALGGVATDNLNVTQVTWVNNRGGNGTAVGTDNWSVAAITLLQGNNTITVTARDAAQNTGIDSITITYNPPATSTSSSTSTVTSTSTTTTLTTTTPSTTTTSAITTTQPSSTSTSSVQPATTTTTPSTTTTSAITTTQPSSTSTSSIMVTTTTTSIEEETVSCDEPKKLSPLSLSSSSDLRPFFGIDNLVDGNPQTAWATLLSFFRKDAYITMDMGSRKTITSLSMYALSIFGIDVLPANIEIQLSNDNVHWDTVNKNDFSASLTPPYADRWQINNRLCRYIKVCITGRQSFFFQFARIAELEIYGCDQTDDLPVAEENNASSATVVLDAQIREQPPRLSPMESVAPGIPGKPLVTFK